MDCATEIKPERSGAVRLAVGADTFSADTLPADTLPADTLPGDADETAGVGVVSRSAVLEVIRRGGPQIVFQPIHHVDSGRVIGAEAFSRFGDHPSTQRWFEAASEFGLRAELELSALGAAVERFDSVTCHRLGWDFVGVNLSTGLVFDRRFEEALSGRPLDRLMVELAEESSEVVYPALSARMGDLRRHGVRVALNSVRCDSSHLARLIDVAPDVVKLDVSFTASLVRAPQLAPDVLDGLRQLTRSGAFVIAVGVERDEELTMLRKLGVDGVQGHLFGRPKPIERLTPAPVLATGWHWA
jgi:EAL domain-containing protein (putative c-di-GMP-specific phosphodiesterase class I)